MPLKTSFKVLFQRPEPTADPRFLKVKLWLMHLGENLNGSSFSKSVVEKALPSLYNIPILGFIPPDLKEGSEDFLGHEEELVLKEDGEVEIVYKGSAYGVIPESCNPTFEWRLCDDGVYREFLTVEGLIWTKFKKAFEILAFDGKRPHSMELAQGYKGNFNDDGIFEFEEFMFEGACILGVDVQPAMKNSTIEVMFTKSINAQVAEILKSIPETTQPNTNTVGDEVIRQFISDLKTFTATVSGQADLMSDILDLLKQVNNHYQEVN